MNIVALTPGEARALAGQVEGLWLHLVQQAAPNIALMSQFARDLTPDELAKLIGPDLIDRARALVEDVRKLHATAKELQAGTAVLVPWQEPPELGISIAVARRNMLPQEATLAIWPIVAITVPIVLSAGAVLWKMFDTETQRVTAENNKLRLEILQRLAQNSAAITDPVFRQKLLDAATKSQAVELTAAGQPQSWLDKFFAGAGALGQAAPVLLLLAVLFFASRGYRSTRRRAA